MGDADGADLRRELAELAAAYRRKLPAKLGELEELLGAARAAGPAGSLQAARDLAHTVKGTSGSHGFDEISADFQVLEEELDRKLAAPSAPDPDWDAVDGALARIRSRL